MYQFDAFWGQEERAVEDMCGVFFTYTYFFFLFRAFWVSFQDLVLDSDFDRIVTLLDLFFSFSSPARSENILLGHSNGERASEHSLILAIYTRTAGVYWFLGGGFLAIFWLYSRSREEMGMGEKFSTCTAKVYATN